MAIQGSLRQGQHALAGAHVYLLAVNTTGYGSPSVSLLTPSSTGQSDSLGAYVTTDTSGAFAIRGDFACPSTGQTYLYSVGVGNAAVTMLAALGSCPDTTGTSAALNVTVNEVTTVAAAYALSGFATDAVHIASSGTPLARTGVSNAMLNAKNLVNPSTGVALTTTPDGNGLVPQAELNTLANMLAACGHSTGSGSSECSTLFTSATNSTGAPAGDTATAAINIAHAAASSVSSLYGLAGAEAEYEPRLSTPPNDFTVGLRFTHPGLPSNGNLTIAVDGAGSVWLPNESNVTLTKLSSTGKVLSPGSGFTTTGMTHPVAIAIDGSGNAWVPNNSTTPTIVEFSNSGTVLGPAAGFTDASFDDPVAVALDGSGNAWIANALAPSLSKLSPSGVVLSPAGGFTGGGIQHPIALAIDGTGNVWTASNANDSLGKFSPAGNALSPPTGFTGGGLDGPISIAIDSANSVWAANYMNGTVSRFSNSGTPANASGFMGGGIVNPVGIAIDGSGTAWVANQFGTVSHLSATGTVISPQAGYILPGSPVVLDALALDGSGDVWLSGDSAVVELIGAATPVVTPLPFGIANNILGTRP